MPLKCPTSDFYFRQVIILKSLKNDSGAILGDFSGMFVLLSNLSFQTLYVERATFKPTFKPLLSNHVYI